MTQNDLNEGRGNKSSWCISFFFRRSWEVSCEDASGL